MKYVALFTAAVVFAASSAMAGVAPKTESVVTKDIITVGDVFSGVTENADFYLAPAPEPGKKMVLGTRDLVRISEALGLGWTPDAYHHRTVLRRSSEAVDSYDIQEAVQRELAKQLGARKFEAELANKNMRLSVPEGAGDTVEVERLHYDAARQTFEATVSVASMPAVKQQVSGRLHHIVEVPVLVTPLRRGDVITRNDVDFIELRADSVTDTTIVDADKLVGQMPRRGIAAMQPVASSDIIPPQLVKKGELVVMHLNANGMNLTTQGRAVQNGSEGDIIRIENETSGQIITAVVTGRRAVTVTPPSVHTVTN